jgi:hypothetical protein
MNDIRSSLHGGVQEKKKLGAERLKTVLDVVRNKGVLSEGELAQATGLDKKDLDRCLEYLRGNGLISVKRRFLKDAEISASGGGNIRIPVKVEVVQASAKTAPQPVIIINPHPLILPQIQAHEPQKPAAEPDSANPLQEPVSPKVEAKPKTAEIKPPEKATAQAQPEHKMGEPATPKDSATAPKADLGGLTAAGGEKVVPENEEELKEVAKSLVTDFVGVMRLFGEAEGQSYSAALLVDRGDIIAISFEHMDTVGITYGDEALHNIQSKFMGTKGDLEIFQMSDDDFNESLQPNVNCLLSAPIKLSSMNIKIKAKERPAPQKKSFLSSITGALTSSDASLKADRQEELKEMRQRKVERIGGQVNLLNFARSIKIDSVKEKRFEELRKLRQTIVDVVSEQVDPKKTQRLEELKAAREKIKISIPSLGGGPTKEERMERLRQMQTQTAPIKVDKPDNTPVKTVKDGRKIATNIDRLYEYVESQGRVKLNDALAAKLKISKTQIEEWAMILEEHSLLELKYPTIGEPEIVSVHADKNPKKEETDGHKKRV